MRFVKSVGVGFAAGLGAMIAAFVVLMLVGNVSMWMDRTQGAGGGGIYVAAVEVPVLVGLLAGMAGFVWQWRRGRRLASV